MDIDRREVLHWSDRDPEAEYVYDPNLSEVKKVPKRRGNFWPLLVGSLVLILVVGFFAWFTTSPNTNPNSGSGFQPGVGGGPGMSPGPEILPMLPSPSLSVSPSPSTISTPSSTLGPGY